MKVVTSVRALYESRKPLYERLKEEVDSFFRASKKEEWHYESRVKQLQSFALKAETGRFSKISELEDFFAASLIVENSTSISKALELVKSRFKISYQRPNNLSFTHKGPDSFVFDDLRLYLVIPENPERRSKGIESVVFELQVKTFLQHAWTIATHDLTYKGNRLNWATSRIAYQVKAMLENAELSILESDRLSKSFLVNKENRKFEDKNKIITYLREKWDAEQLPQNIIGLATNVSELLQRTGVDMQNFRRICDESEFIGDNPPKNISPNMAIVLAIIDRKDDAIELLRSKGKKLFIPDEALELLLNDAQENVSSIRLKPE